MITKITTVEELKRVFVESILNNTNKVTKISDGSVLNGIGYGVGKLGQKTLKDLSIVESRIFPDTAFGGYLDEIAKLNGIAPRFSESPSSGYIRVAGEQGTTYSPGTHTFRGKGINFTPQESVTIGEVGFAYVKVQSLSLGSDTNIESLAINKVSPNPPGHSYCINEFKTSGGRDNESDELFRERIKEGINSLSRGTISYLEQVFRKANEDVLRVYNMGLDSVGDLVIGVSSVNGSDFSQSELDDIFLKSESYFSMNELKPDGMDSYGVKIKNIPYFPIDVSVRVNLDSSINSDKIRREIQISLNKVVDYRKWENGGIIDWIDLVNAVKGVNGVKRVLDNYFYPNNDIIIPKNHLPRIRGFALLNLSGELIVDFQGVLNPIFYPSEIDFNFQGTVLKSL